MNKLDTYFKQYNNIDESTPHEIFYIDPKKLIDKRRIDIIVKYYYIKARESGENLKLAKDIYEKHIEAFTDGTFIEQGYIEKNSIEKYFESFNSLIDDFKKNGFNTNLSIIPIGKHNEILDGSHRVACAIFFNQRVKVIKFNHLEVDYGFNFFKRRLLDDFYLDFIAKEYVNLKKEVYALLVWPKVGNEKNTRYVNYRLNKDGFIVIYKKKLKLSKKDLWNLVFSIYKHEHWSGNPKNKFNGVSVKRDSIYSKEGHLFVFILDKTKISSLIEEKEILREYFSVGKSSVHTTDTLEESIEILNIVLDKDYDKLLYENFLKTKDTEYTFIKNLGRKVRFVYRTLINKIKRIIDMPV